MAASTFEVVFELGNLFVTSLALLLILHEAFVAYSIEDCDPMAAPNVTCLGILKADSSKCVTNLLLVVDLQWKGLSIYL
jgi:hypothetical protein